MPSPDLIIPCPCCHRWSHYVCRFLMGNRARGDREAVYRAVMAATLDVLDRQWKPLGEAHRETAVAVAQRTARGLLWPSGERSVTR